MTGPELKQFREKVLLLSQGELAQHLGVASPKNPAKTISDWERGVYRVPPFLHLALAELKRRLGKK